METLILLVLLLCFLSVFGFQNHKLSLPHPFDAVSKSTMKSFNPVKSFGIILLPILILNNLVVADDFVDEKSLRKDFEACYSKCMFEGKLYSIFNINIY
jgi:hypothetical protein